VVDKPEGRCVLSGALTTSRLPNGDFMCPEYIDGLRSVGDLDENLEYSETYFFRNKHLKKVVRGGHVYAITKRPPGRR
jgi:hypothetical protein